MLPPILYIESDMIDKHDVEAVVARAIEGTDAFVVDLTVSGDNDIVVELDSPTGVDLDFCTEVSRAINEALDRDVEDYSLEVGTASLSAPFRVPRKVKEPGEKRPRMVAEPETLGMDDCRSVAYHFDFK